MNIQQWVDKFYKLKAELPCYRLGQAFANEFRNSYYLVSIEAYNLNIPLMHKKDLFYVTDDKEALLMIMQWLDTKPDGYFETLTEGM